MNVSRSGAASSTKRNTKAAEPSLLDFISILYLVRQPTARNGNAIMTTVVNGQVTLMLKLL